MEGDRGAHIDRISNLPIEVIDVILQHLSMKDLIKTSILSRKWRYIWASVTKLKFEQGFHMNCRNSYHNETFIINDVLFIHNDPLHEFTLHVPSSCQYEYLNKWMLILSRKGLKHLTLLYTSQLPNKIPSHIFLCQDLTYLKLQNSEFPTVPHLCGFKSLVTLHLFNIAFGSGVLESILSGSSFLVDLTISYCSGFKNINVSSILKILRIFGDEVIKSICLNQAQNLVDLTLWADKGGNEIMGGWLSDLMKDLPKIERLDLGGCFEILSAINQRVVPRSAKTLTHLKFSDVNLEKEEELVFLISLLESFPNLEKVDIEIPTKKTQSDEVVWKPKMILKKFDCNYCCFPRLQIVNIVAETDYNPALNFIRFVLAKSSSLKILTFKVGLCLPADLTTLLSMSRDLLQMKRASPIAEVKFLYPSIGTLRKSRWEESMGGLNTPIFFNLLDAF